MIQNRFVKFLALMMTVSAIILVATILFHFSPSIQNGLCLSIALATLNGALTFAALSWAYPKSNKLFFGTLFGGMGWKFLTLGLTAAFIFRNSSFHFLTTLLTFVFLSTIFTFISFRFLPSSGSFGDTILNSKELSMVSPKLTPDK